MRTGEGTKREPQPRAASRLASTSRARAGSQSGVGPIGRRHSPTARPISRSIALAGDRVRCLVAGLEGPALEQSGVDPPGPVGVALGPQVEHLGHVDAGPVGGHADHADGADGEQRQGHVVVAAVDLEVAGRARRPPAPSRPGCRRHPSAPTTFGTSRARRSSVSVVILRPVRTGMS